MTKTTRMAVCSSVLLAILFLLPVTRMSLAAEIVSNAIVQLESRPTINQPFILIRPAKPVASVILFAGGKGKLELFSANGKVIMGKMKVNFVVKMREQFANHGFMVAVYEVPSDQKANGMRTVWRLGEEHAKDIGAIVQYLKEQADIPVWLVGTSRGTISAVNGAVRLQKAIDGLVLTSSMTKIPKEWRAHKDHPNGILDMDLEKITVPTLIVSHRDDRCKVTPPEDSDRLQSAFVNASIVDLLFFTGGKKAVHKPCMAKSPHGFYGIEDHVVAAIADFIKAN